MTPGAIRPTGALDGCDRRVVAGEARGAHFACDTVHVGLSPRRARLTHGLSICRGDRSRATHHGGEGGGGALRSTRTTGAGGVAGGGGEGAEGAGGAEFCAALGGGTKRADGWVAGSGEAFMAWGADVAGHGPGKKRGRGDEGTRGRGRRRR